MLIYDRGWTLCDFLEALPREWISEELMEALADKVVYLSPTMYAKEFLSSSNHVLFHLAWRRRRCVLKN